MRCATLIARPVAISLTLAVFASLPRPAVAQSARVLSGVDCGQRAGRDCRTSIITEATYSLRLSGKANQRNEFGGPAWANAAAHIGFVTPLARRVQVGAVGTIGLWDGFYAAVGPRVRYHATADVAVDLTPQVVLQHSQPGGGKVLLDLGVLYRNQIGISVQLGQFQQTHYGPNFPDAFDAEVVDRRAVFAGIRLASKPGRLGMLADATALAGLFAFYYIACATSGCD